VTAGGGERRQAEHSLAEPRQRRRFPWSKKEPRERRRSRWGDFRDAYPRIVTAMSFGIVLFLLLDVGLALAAYRYSRERARAERSMTTLERERSDALMALPADRRVPGALGPLALVLDDGTVVYSPPDQGPLADATYVMPGAVRAQRADLEAIRENLTPGLPVYFH
jgi:hypothetical protein